MDAEWIKSPTARRVLVHWADDRPAWLWSADGRSLLWRNGAAAFFHARVKKSGLKRGPEPAPIKGQVARLLRLGSLGRSSLSRIQFLAGGKPLSATCTVTPLELAGGELALLIVAVDPIDAGVLEASAEQGFDSLSNALFPPGAEYLLVENGTVRDGSPRARERFAEAIGLQGMPNLPETDSGEIDFAGSKVRLTRYRASPQDAVLLLFEPLEPDAAESRIESIRAEEGLVALHERASPAAPEATEPLLPIGLPPLEETAPHDAAESGGGFAGEDLWVEPFEPPAVGPGRSLSSLFDRLAGHEELYAPLPEPEESPEPPAVSAAAEPVAAPVPAAQAERPTEPATAAPAAGEGPDVIAAVIEFADDSEEIEEAPEPAPPVTYRVIGRGFAPLAGEAPVTEAPPAAEVPPQPAAETAAGAAAPPPSPEVVERVSRYNFDELSRILTDRVGSEGHAPGAAIEIESPIEPGRPPLGRAPDHALVNVAGETFILNRLPIGIMVFRDQQVAFANRALTDLVGYESIDALRSAGLAAVFPSEDAAVAGPVTHLVHSNGTLLPVVARLQSITWQGRPALMLSASLAQPGAGYEGVVKAFAEALAEQRGEGFVVADRAGVVTRVSAKFCGLLGSAEADIVGKPLSALIAARDGAALRDFLEGPAKFAETARPCLQVNGLAAPTSLLLFAEGRAGIVSGYFGLLRREPVLAAGRKADEMIEPSMLARVSRGVRRPLNTIIGFSDLIRSAAFGTIENQRYLEYARDIKTAGQEIAALVDELDDIARLKEGSYAARPAELDLGGLLESCMVRVREQAGAARVLVRSAISERLPRIRADRASLRQAVLNLLASAIDQTPPGGTVVLSAQLEDDGSIAVNVRDSGGRGADPAERFVVFRDGVGKDGEMLLPMRSSVGLALTRSLLAVNTCSLSVDPSAGVGTLFSLLIPADLVAR